MTTRYHSMINYVLLTFMGVAVAGCGGGLSRENISDTTTRLAIIEVTRNAQKTPSDCPVTVKISNRTRIDWDGVSYHLVMHNRNGVTIGKLLGSPKKRIKAGEDLIDSGVILGAKCEQMTGIALVYFGYYPAGKKQVSVHNANVQVRMK